MLLLSLVRLCCISHHARLSAELQQRLCVSFDSEALVAGLLLLLALQHVAVSDGGRRDGGGCLFMDATCLSVTHQQVFLPRTSPSFLLLVLLLHTESGHIWILRTGLVGLFSVLGTLQRQVCRFVSCYGDRQ